MRKFSQFWFEPSECIFCNYNYDKPNSYDKYCFISFRRNVFTNVLLYDVTGFQAFQSQHF